MYVPAAEQPQEFLGDLRGVSHPTISRIVAKLVPVVKGVLEEFVPDAKYAIEMAQGRVCLVDGTVTPCWSYAGPGPGSVCYSSASSTEIRCIFLIPWTGAFMITL